MAEQNNVKKYKDYTSLKAWQVGHEITIQAENALQEFVSDPHLSYWCNDLLTAYRDSVVQVIEAFYKRASGDKLRRWEAANFYINKALYTIQMGREAGWWQLDDLEKSTKQYADIGRGSAYYFVKEIAKEKEGQTD